MHSRAMHWKAASLHCCIVPRVICVMLIWDRTCSKGALLCNADIIWPGHAVPPGRLPRHGKGQPGSTQRLPAQCCICFQGPCGSKVRGFSSGGAVCAPHKGKLKSIHASEHLGCVYNCRCVCPINYQSHQDIKDDPNHRPYPTRSTTKPLQGMGPPSTCSAVCWALVAQQPPRAQQRPSNDLRCDMEDVIGCICMRAEAPHGLRISRPSLPYARALAQSPYRPGPCHARRDGPCAAAAGILRERPWHGCRPAGGCGCGRWPAASEAMVCMPSGVRACCAAVGLIRTAAWAGNLRWHTLHICGLWGAQAAMAPSVKELSTILEKGGVPAEAAGSARTAAAARRRSPGLPDERGQQMRLCSTGR